MAFWSRLFGPPNIERLKARRSIRGLIKALNYQPNPSVRKAAAEALGSLGDKRAVLPLIASLKDVDFSVGLNAAFALGYLKDRRAVDPLITTLRDGTLSGAAGYALKNIGDPNTIELLIPLFNEVKHADDGRHYKVAEALDMLGYQPSDPQTAFIFDLALCKIENIVAMGASAVEPLLKIATNEKEPLTQRGLAAEALGLIGNLSAIAPLRSLLIRLDKVDRSLLFWPEFRHKVELALVQLGDDTMVERLLKTIVYSSIENGKQAKAALLKLGSSAVGPLIRSLKNDDTNLRAVAGGILKTMGRVAIEPLKGTLYEIRPEVTAILSELGVSKEEIEQARAANKVDLEMLYLRSEGEVIQHIVSGIQRLSPERVLVAGGGKNFSEALRNALQPLSPKYQVFWNESYSLSWLCRKVEEIRSKGRKTILLSNYPRETDPPSARYLENGVTPKNIIMPAGTSLRLCAPDDTSTRVAIYLVGAYTMSYCRNVYFSQALGRQKATTFQVLVSPGANDLMNREVERLNRCKERAESQRVLEEIAEELDMDSNTSAVAWAGGILMA